MAFVLSNLIFDRSTTDVSRVEEIAVKLNSGTATTDEVQEWLSGMKGGYSYRDLNRVSNAMEYLVAELLRYGYGTPGYKPGPVWKETDIQTPEQMEQYRRNVVAIRAVLEMFRDTPQTPDSMEGLTYQKANDLEKILYDVERVIEQIVRGTARSNCFTFWSGNRPFPCASSALGRTWAELDAMQTEWKNWQVATWYLLLYGNLEAEGVVS